MVWQPTSSAAQRASFFRAKEYQTTEGYNPEKQNIEFHPHENFYS
jgi:hypothetical protein